MLSLVFELREGVLEFWFRYQVLKLVLKMQADLDEKLPIILPAHSLVSYDEMYDVFEQVFLALHYERVGDMNGACVGQLRSLLEQFVVITRHFGGFQGEVRQISDLCERFYEGVRIRTLQHE